MKEIRSKDYILRSFLGVNRWLEETPTVDLVRPAACPACHRASQPLGESLGLQGHGLRARKVRGPRVVGEAPTERTIPARRYRCQSCGAVMMVVPKEIERRRLYARTAIALALALHGLLLQASQRIREQVCTVPASPCEKLKGWVTLRRWARSVGNGTLLAGLFVGPLIDSTRRIASLAASALVALSPQAESVPREVRAFHGAMRFG